jgi:hypothetical protein
MGIENPLVIEAGGFLPINLQKSLCTLAHHCCNPKLAWGGIMSSPIELIAGSYAKLGNRQSLENRRTSPTLGSRPESQNRLRLSSFHC